MAKRPELYLIRHGETEWTLSGQHTGRTDISLTPAGREQALGLVQRLAGKQFALVLNSPLRRAAETCQLAGFGNVSVAEPNLMEWHYGSYEGITSVQIRVTAPGWSVWTQPVPEGETIAEVAARARAVIDRALAAGGDVALFSHGHMLRVLIATWLGLPPEGGRYFALSTASITRLGWENESAVIRM